MTAWKDQLVKPLLFITCSQRKIKGLGQGRAWDIYDGALYRVLKKLFRLHPEVEQAVNVLIMSAKYGIIRPYEVISTYDEILTPAILHQRGAFWAEQLRTVTEACQVPAVFVNLGRAYLRALPNLANTFRGAHIQWARGGIGQRCSQTRRWVLKQVPGLLPPGCSDSTRSPYGTG
jgi:hypothetical protein